MAQLLVGSSGVLAVDRKWQPYEVNFSLTGVVQSQLLVDSCMREVNRALTVFVTSSRSIADAIQQNVIVVFVVDEAQTTFKKCNNCILIARGTFGKILNKDESRFRRGICLESGGRRNTSEGTRRRFGAVIGEKSNSACQRDWCRQNTRENVVVVVIAATVLEV